MYVYANCQRLENQLLLAPTDLFMFKQSYLKPVVIFDSQVFTLMSQRFK